MLKIYEAVARIFKRHYSGQNSDFKRGFSTCLKLFEIGIRKSWNFNLAVRNKELEVINREQAKRIQIINKQLKKFTETEIYTGFPTESFQEYILDTVHGKFSIVTNMFKETLEICLISFTARFNFNTAEEGKSKLLKYINSKQSYGYKAYKNWKECKKENPNAPQMKQK